MSNNVEESRRYQIRDVYEPLEQQELLYVARIPTSPGLILSGEDETIATGQQGEIRLYGKMRDGIFTIVQMRRIALAGSVRERSSEEPFGSFSIVGPLDQPDVGQSGAGLITNLRFQLNYKELSLLGLDDFRQQEEQDVYFPPFVYLVGEMIWEQSGEPRPDGITLAVQLTFFDDVEANADKYRNRARQINFEKELLLDFVWAGTPSETVQLQQRASAAAQTLFSCAAPETRCAPEATLENVRKLPLRFINLSTAADEDRSAEIFSSQFQGICEVWRGKAILSCPVVPQVKQGKPEQIKKYKVFFPVRLEDFLNDKDLDSVGHIDVCLVDDVQDDAGSLPGGGATYLAGKNSACVFLSVSVAATNQYLLAHELGHVLGLGHPELGEAGTVATVDGDMQFVIGSLLSVMQAGLNSNQNSHKNCMIFSSSLLNPLVTDVKPIEKDCLRPDFA